jgi:hypothetical protein
MKIPIAWFLILLVLSIPFVSANISYTTSSDSDNSLGYKSTDNIFVSVNATGVNYSNTTIRLYNFTGLIFTNTTNTQGLYAINYTSLKNGVYTFNATSCDLSNNCTSTLSRRINIYIPVIVYCNATVLTNCTARTGGDDVSTNVTSYNGTILNGTVNYNGTGNTTYVPAPTITRLVLKGIPQGLEGEYSFTSIGGAIKSSFGLLEDSPNSTRIVTFYMSNSTLPFATSPASCDSGLCSATATGVPSAGTVRVKVNVTNSGGSDIRVGTIKSVPMLTNGDWTGSAVANPENWDREVSKKINQKAYVEVTLDSPSMTLNTATFEQCISSNGSTRTSSLRGIEYISSVSYIGPSDDLKKQYLVLESKTTDFYFDGISLDCRFKVSSYSDNGIVPEEIVTAKVNIKFYDNPVGLADKNLMDKVDSAVSKTKGVWKTLDQVYKFVKYLELVCKLYNFVREIIELITAIGFLLGITELQLTSSVVTAPASQGVAGAEKGTCTAESNANKVIDNAFVKYIHYFCQWVTCEMSLWEMFANFDKVSATKGGSGSTFNVMYTNKFSGFVDTVDKYNQPGYAGGTNSSGGLNTYGKIARPLAASGVTIFDEDNIVYMFMQMCIPGILKKAHQWRAIQCSYALCVIEQAQSGIMDETICESVRSSQECVYLLKIFNFVPFSGLMNMVYEYIKNFWASDSIGKIMMVISTGCSYACNSPKYSGTIKWFCDGWIKVQNVINSASTLNKMVSEGDTFKVTGANDKACEDMDKAYGNFKKTQESAKGNITSGSSSNVSSTGGTSSGYGGSAATTGSTTSGSTTTGTSSGSSAVGGSSSSGASSTGGSGSSSGAASTAGYGGVAATT